MLPTICCPQANTNKQQLLRYSSHPKLAEKGALSHLEHTAEGARAVRQVSLSPSVELPASETAGRPALGPSPPEREEVELIAAPVIP